MNILGIQLGHDGSACVVKDGEIACAISTERLTKKKKDRGITLEVLDYVLNGANLTLEDIDMVSLNNWFWDKGLDGKELFNKESAKLRLFDKDGSEYTEENFLQRGRLNSVQEAVIEICGIKKLCIMPQHHLSHCAYSFFTSPFDEALCISIDFGDNALESSSCWIFSKKEGRSGFQKIPLAFDFKYGSYYGKICDYLGFYPSLTGAGKVMALAGLGRVRSQSQKLFLNQSRSSAIQPFNGDPYYGTLSMNGVYSFPQRTVFYPQLEGEGGEPDPFWRSVDDWDTQLSKDIAATAQFVLETSIKEFVSEAASYVEDLPICLSGGTNLNCVSNGNLIQSFDADFHIGPACGDDGLSVGGALFCENFHSSSMVKPKKNLSFKSIACGGVSYSDNVVKEALDEFSDKIKVKPYDENEVSNRILKGEIAGWLQGGSEFGPRALGFRSILANPFIKGMKDKLNNNVKFRENFRPYSPITLKHMENLFFEFKNENKPRTWSKYMLATVPILPYGEDEELKAFVENISSGQGGSRTQVLEGGDNDKLSSLISLFGEKNKDRPVLLNTSFNIQGQPIVETPRDAVESFLNMNLDFLVIENYLIDKV